MKKIAVLVSDNLLPDSEAIREDSFELDEEMGKITPAFAALGMETNLVRWRDASKVAADYDAMLPLFVWDYFEGNEAAFLTEIGKAAKHTKIFKSHKLLKQSNTYWLLTKGFPNKYIQFQ